jgi:hypothetical protein
MSLLASPRRGGTTSARIRHSPRCRSEKAAGHDDRHLDELPAQSPGRDCGALQAIAYRVKERLRDLHRTSDFDEARRLLEELQGHCPRRAIHPRSKSSDGPSGPGSPNCAITTWPR